MNWQKYINGENSINDLPKVHRWRCSSIFSVSCWSVERKSIPLEHWEGNFDMSIISQPTLVVLAANRWPEKSLWKKHCRCLQNEMVMPLGSCNMSSEEAGVDSRALCSGVLLGVIQSASCHNWCAAIILCPPPLSMCLFSYQVIALIIENKSCRKCLCGYT